MFSVNIDPQKCKEWTDEVGKDVKARQRRHLQQWRSVKTRRDQWWSAKRRQEQGAEAGHIPAPPVIGTAVVSQSDVDAPVHQFREVETKAQPSDEDTE